MANQKPEKKFVRGSCSVSIFVNEVSKNGQTFSIKKAVFQKRYRDQNGDWQNTSSLDTNDVPKAVRALEDAYDYLTKNDKNDNENDAAPEP